MGDFKKWQGRTALVTGASAGIGRAIALLLADSGMNVALAARRNDRLEKLRESIEQRGGRALSLPLDLRDETQLKNAFERIAHTFGGTDVLVNSAGLGRLAPLMTGATEAFREMLEVNVLALAVATRYAIADMTKRDAAGQIIHISSMSAYRVQSGMGMYGATKHAVRALTEGLRLELREAGSPIRVTAISPADTESEFAEHYYGSAEAAEAHRPSYTPMRSQDIAEAVMYVLSTPENVEVHDLLLRPREQPD